MDINLYLKNKLECCTSYSLNPLDQEALDKFGVEKFIYKKLTSAKFRKWQIDEETSSQTRNALHLNIAQNKPIKFVFPFGGYKLWRLSSFPEVDWADFFTISYFLNYLSPILQVYKPGADFTFSSDDIIIELMDNVSKKDTDLYFTSFKKLLALFDQFFPENLTMEIIRIADFYNSEEFEEELAEKVEKIKKDCPSWDPAKKESMLKTSRLNICWKGVKDLTKLSQEEKEEMIKMGPIYHDSYGSLSKRRAYNRAEDKIMIFAIKIPKAIPIGTTKNSITKFWTGFGVLEKNKGQLRDRILSPEQFEKAKSLPHETVKSNLIPLLNFKEILVYLQPFDFSHRG